MSAARWSDESGQALMSVRRALLGKVTPSIGQTGGGVLDMLESMIARIPVIGAPITAARTRAADQFAATKTQAFNDFGRGAINEVLAPIGETLDEATPMGRANAQLDQPFLDDLNQINRTLSLPQDRARQIQQSSAEASLQQHPAKRSDSGSDL
jgi:hypothetical protein